MIPSVYFTFSFLCNCSRIFPYGGCSNYCSLSYGEGLLAKIHQQSHLNNVRFYRSALVYSLIKHKRENSSVELTPKMSENIVEIRQKYNLMLMFCPVFQYLIPGNLVDPSVGNKVLTFLKTFSVLC